MRPNVDAEAVEAVRQFNRHYTRQLGLLEQGLLDSAFSLSETRILYELAHRDGVTASVLAQELTLDAGYLSRLLKRLSEQGLVDRTRDKGDARQAVLRLSAAGRQAFAPLERAARRQVADWLRPLQPDQRADLLRAMRRIQRLLGGSPEPAVPYLLRPHQVGDIGWIVHRHGVLYAQEYGWDETFEALVAEIAGRFVREFDPQAERCWVAERDGDIVGSVFLVRAQPEVAQLRLLYVEPCARGLGIGGRLTAECIRFSRERGYRRMMLWTNDVLVSARRIYQAAGFQLTKEEPHHSFGKDLVGQTWELALT